jgi:hypothetical protein
LRQFHVNISLTQPPACKKTVAMVYHDFPLRFWQMTGTDRRWPRWNPKDHGDYPWILVRARDVTPDNWRINANGCLRSERRISSSKSSKPQGLSEKWRRQWMGDIWLREQGTAPL